MTNLRKPCFAGLLAGPLDTAHLGRARPAEVRRAFAADGELSRLDAAVALVGRPCAVNEIGGWRALMRRRRRCTQGPDQFRGGKASPKATARSAIRVGWLALTANR